MKTLSQGQLSELMDLENEYNCNFYLPPFYDKIDCCFYDIDKISRDAIKFQEFLIKVKKVKVAHKFIDIKGRKFMAVTR